MKMIEFIDAELIGLACKKAFVESETELAILISAKFCEKVFTLRECVQNIMAISTFCATTICIAGGREFKGLKGTRPFSIKDDLHNELSSACDRGYEPLPILGYLYRPKKHMASNIISGGSTEMEVIAANHLHDEQEYSKEEILSFLTPAEKLIIHHVDGNMQIKPIMRGFGLNHSEAASVVNVITKKIKANF